MKSIFTLLSLLITTMLFSQTVLFNENFEGTTVNMTSSSTGSGTWVVNNRLQSQGLKSDSATVTMGDTTYLITSSTIDATGLPQLYLQFSHIAKVEFFDGCEIEVSANGGTSWTKLMPAQYLGTGYFALGYFSSASYPSDWQGTTPAAIPQNSWWKTELFDISTIAGDSSDVVVRFVLSDKNNSGNGGNAGWFIDSVVVKGSLGELTPPAISLVSPNHLDTLTQGTDYAIIAEITDASGIDTAYVNYITSTGVSGSATMVMTSPDTFQAIVPFIGFGRIIDYQIFAIDSSPAANMTVDPALGYHRIVAKYKPGMGVINYSEGFESGFPSDWTQVTYDNMNWTRKSGGTTSTGTGPTGAHEGTWYMYTETSGFSNKTAIIETPQFNIDTIFSPMVSFYYHMYGATMGDLYFEVLNGQGAWVTLWSMSGQQQTANAEAWREAIVDVSMYQTDTTKFRFRGQTGTSYTSDMCIDDFKLGGPVLLSRDIGVNQILNPTGGVMAGTALPVQVTFNNYGSDTITTATLAWSYDGTLQTSVPFTGSLIQGAQSASITVGTKTPVLGSHSIKVWTENPNGTPDFNFGNDSMFVDFYACANLLSGTYTIDPNGTGATNYMTFTEAALALNQCGINGAVTFNVASGTYNEQFKLMPVNGSSSTNTITFQSAAGDSSLVILKHDAAAIADNYVVDLDGTSYISFKNMSFEAEDTLLSNVFVLENAVHDFAVENCVVKATVLSTTNGVTMSLFSTVVETGANISIQHNLLLNSSYAINLVGAANATNWVVNDNTIHGNYAQAIKLENSVSAVITNNDIAADTASTFGGYEGIFLLNGTGSAMISKNSIYTKNISTGYGIRMTSCLFDSLNPTMVVNNYIQMHVNSTGTTISAGIINHETRFVNVFYNTVRMSGVQLNSPAMCLFDGTAGLSRGITIIDNIFTNDANGYVYYVNNVDTSLWVDHHNNIYNFNSTADFSYLGAAVSDYATWVTGSGTMNTENVDPYFASATDLHISNNFLNGLGTPIASVTDDYDGDLRDATHPDMGADEFIASPNDIATLEILTPIGSCGMSNAETVTVRYKNIGSAAITSFNAKYQLVGSSTTVSEAVSTTINPGDTLNYIFATTVDLDIHAFGTDSAFIMKAWGELAGDSDHSNDTTDFEINSGYVPDTVHVDNDTITYGQSDTLYATGNSIFWWATDTSSTELANDTLFVTGPLYDTTTYWVSDRAGAGLMNIQVGNGTLTNTASGYPSPYTNWYWGNKEQYLVLASELTALGMSAGPITAVQFDVAAVNSVPVLNNYEISIGETSVNALTTWISGLAVAYSPGSYMATSGWNEHVFSTPFEWDGVSNIVVQVCSNNSAYVSSGNASVNSSTTSFNSVLNFHTDAAGVCQNSGLTFGFPGTQRPNMKLTVDALGCSGDRTSFTVVVIGFPSDDASLVSIVEPTGTIPAGTKTAVKAVLKNYGQTTMTSVDIPYSINGVMTDTITWTGSLAYTAVDTFLLDSIIFSGGAVHFEAYTTLTGDTIFTNDTTSIDFVACLNGTYSIGDTTTGNFDFGSFNGAVAALNAAGVCSNVVFNVEAGTYEEQVVIEEIVGVGPNATITFQSASGDSTDVIVYDSTNSSTASYVILLDGADYMIFKNLTFNANGANYATGIEMKGEAEHNAITNCVFLLPPSISYNKGGIYAFGKVSYTMISNNRIVNGGKSIVVQGSGGSNVAFGNTITNNICTGFGNQGIAISYQDSVIVKNNELESGYNLNYGYGLYVSYCFHNFEIANNSVKILQGSTSTKYGLYVSNSNYYSYVNGGTISGEGLVYNNTVVITAGTSTKYGLYASYNDDVKFYYNSIMVSGISTNARALYQTNTTQHTNGETFINNVFIDSVGGYAAYFQQTATVNTLDYNDYYTNGGSIGYWGGAQATLADLKTASGQNAHSINVLPIFAGATDLHLISYNLSGLATPVVAVTTDFDGTTRSTTNPTIGFHEKPLLPINIGVTQVLSFPDTVLEAAQIPIVAKVKNFGTDTIYTFAVEYKLDNGTPVTVAYNDTLAPGAYDNVTMPTLTAPAGDAVFCAYTVLATDIDTLNDGLCYNFYATPTKDAVMFSINAIDAACNMANDTITVMITNIGIDSINAVGQTNPTNVHYQVNGGSVVTELFSSVVAPDDTVSYTFTTLYDFTTGNVADSVFEVVAWITFVGDFVQTNDSAHLEVTSLHTPIIPIAVTPVNIAYASMAQLSATSPSNDLLSWYRYDTSTVSLDTGAAYTTTFLYATDSFYVRASGAGAAANVGIGNGAVVNVHLPMEMFYGYTYSQSLYLPADFNGTTGLISKISYYYNGSGTYADNIEIYMGTTTQSTFVTTSDWVDYADLTTVYSGTFNTNGTAGWVEITLDMPFFYDGKTNLVVAFDENTPGYHSSSDDMSCTVQGIGRSIYYYNDGTNPDPMNPPTTGFSLGTNDNVPNTKFFITPQGCSSANVQVDVIVGAQPANDVAVLSIDKPITGIYKTNHDTVVVQLVNFGSAAQSNVPMKYSINGSSVVADVHVPSIASGDTVTFTYAQVADLSGVDSVYNFTAYSDLANDANHSNDTMHKAVENEIPSYCISSATNNGSSEITNVSLGATFSNTSAVSHAVYTDFTQTVSPIDLQVGVATTVDIATSFTPTNTYNSAGYLKIFIDYNRDGDFDDANEEAFGGASQCSGNVIGALSVPYTVIAGNTAMRIVHAIYGSSTSVHPCGTYFYGETEDYVVNILPRIPNDAGVNVITNPETIASAASTSLIVDVMNYGTDVITSVDVSYTLNGGAVVTTTYNTAPIAPLAKVNLNLGTIMLTPGTNLICAYTTLANDTNNFNDTICKTVYLQATVNLVYNDDFEGADIWMPDTLVNQWERGIPTAVTINSAHSPVNVWAVKLDTIYDNNSDDYLYSPRIVTTGLDSAILKFWNNYDTKSSDGGAIQVSIDNGPWITLGLNNDPNGVNWYNTTFGGNPWWSNSSNGWIESSYKLHLTNTTFDNPDTLQFRFYFHSNGFTNDADGWAIDDFSVELAKVAKDAGVIAINSPAASVPVGSAVTVEVSVQNFGTDTLMSIPVSYTIGGTTETATFTVPTPGLLPDSVKTYSFVTGFTAPNIDFSICAKTSLVGDLYPQNDETCKQVQVTMAPIDAKMIGLAVSPIWHDTTKVTFDDTVTIQLINNGTTTLTSIDLEYKVGAAVKGTGTWTGSLASTDTLTYTFTQTYTSLIGYYQVCAKATVTGDADNTNDEFCSNFFGILDVGMDENNGDVFSVEQNQPNPAHGKVLVDFNIPQSGKVHFELRNALGQVIVTEELDRTVGKNQFEIDATSLASGVYYYTVEFDKQRITKKMIVNN